MCWAWHLYCLTTVGQENAREHKAAHCEQGQFHFLQKPSSTAAQRYRYPTQQHATVLCLQVCKPTYNAPGNAPAHKRLAAGIPCLPILIVPRYQGILNNRIDGMVATGADAAVPVAKNRRNIIDSYSYRCKRHADMLTFSCLPRFSSSTALRFSASCTVRRVSSL